MEHRARPWATTRPTGTLATVAVWVLWVSLAFFAYHSWRNVKAEQIRNMDSVALLMSRSLDAFFSSEQSGLLSLADGIGKSPQGLRNLRKVQQELAAYKQHRSEISLVLLADLDGHVLASSDRSSLSDLPSLGDQPSMREFLKNDLQRPGVLIGRPQLGRLTHAWTFSLRYVLRDAGQRPLAILAAVVPTDFLVDFWRNAPATRTMTVGLLGDDGYLLSRYPLPVGADLASMLGKPRTGALYGYLREHGFPPSGVEQGPIAPAPHQQFVSAFHRLRNFPLTVFTQQPQRQIVGDWARLMLAPLFLTVLLSAALRLAARHLRRREAAWEQERELSAEATRASESAHRQLVDQLMTGLVVHDGEGAVLRANPEACRVLGLTMEQMQGKELVDPAWCFLDEHGMTLPVAQYPVSRVLVTGRRVENLIVGIQKPQDPAVAWVICRADPVHDGDARMKQIVVSLNDITQMRRLREDLRDRETRFRALFDHSMDAVLLTTPDDGGVVAANPAACAMFRRSESEIRRAGRQGLVDLLDPRSDALARRRAREGQVIGEVRMVRGDGSHFEAEISSSIYQDSSGRRFSSMIVRDISERVAMQAAMEAANQQLREANENLAKMAHYDLLTQLPNRNLLGDRLEQAMAHADRHGRIVGVAFVDLDGFKSINDQFGHAVGDQVLIHMARRLKTTLREGDTLARIGGDEFVAVLSDLEGVEDLRPLIHRLQAQAAEPITLGHVALKVTASIGVTNYPADASDAEHLLRHADQAMYLAKQAGKNQYHAFDVISDAAVRVRREELGAIKAGCEQGEFVLHYQPEVDMRTGRLMGVEALVRWKHPERGLLSPDQFLPLVEDHEFAVEMGRMILDMALAQMERWQLMGLTVPVSVNLFARQLQDSGFVARLSELLEQHPAASPRHLLLEIVETKALEDVAQASDAMRACAQLGVRFALDDFGTGYSSLTYLKALPASLLKIDKGFVRDMLDDEDDLGIVQGVIGLARAFGREVIAEGVESVAHGRLLLSLGCNLGQGYAIARPMPADDLPRWLALWQARQPWVSLPPGSQSEH